MRTEQQTVIMPIFAETGELDEYGYPAIADTGETQELVIIDIYADEGKTLRRIGDTVTCEHITLGTGDAVSDYEEVVTL